MEEALFLTKFADRVTVIHRRPDLRASRIMQQRARDHAKISFLMETEVTEVVGEASVTGLKLRHVRTGETSDLAVQGLFLAIGHDPATEVFRGKLDLDPKGYVRTHEVTRTSVEGVFAAGDVYDHRYRQAVSAAGLGCMAALDVEKHLAEKGLAPNPPASHSERQPIPSPKKGLIRIRRVVAEVRCAREEEPTHRVQRSALRLLQRLRRGLPAELHLPRRDAHHLR
jgi:pyruvate/2-oxoglutarate dehydrogenase complex dihydrolipoamide dehydrogenase (E3) component